MSRAFYAFALILSAGMALFTAWMAALNKEAIYASDKQFYLELRPADPRSLMQGDYMRLAYEADRQVAAGQNPAWAIVATDSRGRGSVLSLQQKLPDLSADPELGLLAIPVQKIGTRALIQPRSFFFQEGLAPQFDQARYAVFKYRSASDALLFGLADANRQLIASKK